MRGALGGRCTLLVAAVLASACASATVAGGAAAGPGLFFGISADEPKAHGAAAVDPARGLGARALRLTLRWEPGLTELAPEDVADMARAVAAAPDMRVVVAVYGGAWASPVTAVDRNEYCAYTRNLLTLFPTIRDVVIWNEPNLSYFWQPQFHDDGSSAAPAAYAALLARCWDVLHAYDPSVNVIAPATGPHGADNPGAAVNVSHAAATFIRKLGDAYRASGRDAPILDTVAHHVYGDTSAERPWRMHTSTHLSQGDYVKLVAALADAFGGTAQPTPGECGETRCVSIWYLEGGFQTGVRSEKAGLYFGSEPNHTVPDDAGGEPLLPTPSADTPAPDQATQIGYALRLAYCQPHVGAFFNFMLWDDPNLARWQSAPFWADGTPKASYAAFRQAIDEAQAGDISCDPPTPPPHLKARVDGSCWAIALDWGASSSTLGVSGYRLYRDGQLLLQTNERSYVDRNVECSRKYRYTVRAFDAAGRVSPASVANQSTAMFLTVVKMGGGSGTVRSEPDGRLNCGPLCGVFMPGDNEVELTATAASGSVFSGWYYPCGGTDSCWVRMDEDRYAIARFTLVERALTVAPPPPGLIPAATEPAAQPRPLRLTLTTRGRGRVVSSPAGIDCGRTCSTELARGTTVILRAQPARGWVFTRWGDPCGSAGRPGECVFHLDASAAVTATFQRAPCVVPALVRKRVAAAKRALAKTSCRLGRVHQTSGRRGVVVAQKPAPRVRRAHGAKVDLYVGRGPKR